MSTIGTRIRARREQLGLSQEELGKRLGYKSRSSINKIELDQRNLTQSKIKAIADALETTPSYIMGWQEDGPDKAEEESLIDMFKRLSTDEKIFLNYFRDMDPEERDMVTAVMKTIMDRKK